MEKTLRALALLSIVGAFALVFAQQQVASAGEHGTSGKSAYKAGNSMQQLLRWHFTNRQNAEIEAAQAGGNASAVAGIIKVNCFFNLALMRPDEQRHEIQDVMQIDKWVPNDKGWAAVAKSPTLAKELLDVDKSTLIKIQAKWDEIEEAFFKPFHESMHRLAATPGFDKLSREQQNRLIQAENDKLNEGKSIVERSAASAVRSGKAIAYARTLLDKNQLAELDHIVQQFERDLTAVVAGRTPSFLNP